MKPDNIFLRLWRRLANWVHAGPPDTFDIRFPEESVFETPDTDTLEARILERHTPKPRETKFYNKTFAERFIEWEKTKGVHYFGQVYKVMSVIICVVIIGVLLLTVSYLPAFGQPDNPASNEVVAKYIQDTLKDTGATNAVAGIILDYRAFDTFGEACVLFLASCSVMILLRQDDAEKGASPIQRMDGIAGRDTILAKASQLLIPVVMLFGVYVILNGHIGPGGGFAGGTIIGAGMILYLTAFGNSEFSRFFTHRTYRKITFFSLCFYALAKGYSFFTGANHMESGIPLGTPGAILSGGLILPLNICIGLVVACTMYGFFSLFSKGEI